MDQQLHRSGKVTAADSYNRFGIYKPITSAKIKFPVKPIDNIDKCTDRINIPKLNVHFLHHKSSLSDSLLYDMEIISSMGRSYTGIIKE